MATNLRLRPEAAEALRAESERTGQSQQDLIRRAIDRFLGLETWPAASAPRSAAEALVASGTALPARAPYDEPDELLPLPVGVSTLDLLDRDERR